MAHTIKFLSFSYGDDDFEPLFDYNESSQLTGNQVYFVSRNEEPFSLSVMQSILKQMRDDKLSFRCSAQPTVEMKFQYVKNDNIVDITINCYAYENERAKYTITFKGVNTDLSRTFYFKENDSFGGVERDWILYKMKDVPICKKIMKKLFKYFSKMIVIDYIEKIDSFDNESCELTVGFKEFVQNKFDLTLNPDVALKSIYSNPLLKDLHSLYLLENNKNPSVFFAHSFLSTASPELAKKAFNFLRTLADAKPQTQFLVQVTHYDLLKDVDSNNVLMLDYYASSSSPLPCTIDELIEENKVTLPSSFHSNVNAQLGEEYTWCLKYCTINGVKFNFQNNMEDDTSIKRNMVIQENNFSTKPSEIISAFQTLFTIVKNKDKINVKGDLVANFCFANIVNNGSIVTPSYYEVEYCFKITDGKLDSVMHQLYKDGKAIDCHNTYQSFKTYISKSGVFPKTKINNVNPLTLHERYHFNNWLIKNYYYIINAINHEAVDNHIIIGLCDYWKIPTYDNRLVVVEDLLLGVNGNLKNQFLHNFYELSSERLQSIVVATNGSASNVVEP